MYVVFCGAFIFSSNSFLTWFFGGVSCVSYLVCSWQVDLVD